MFGKVDVESNSDSVDIKEQKNLRFSKPPSYASELMFVMLNMFLLKFYSERFFEAMTFFYVAIPMMLFLIISLFKNLFEFIKLLHIEDITGSDEENAPLVTPGQQKLLIRVLRDLCAYFGIYYLSAELDVIFTLKEGVLDSMATKTEF